MEENRIKHKQTEHDKNNSWYVKLIVGSGWGRDGREIESNTSRQSAIKKTAGAGS
jgi:hypothetical protein